MPERPSVPHCFPLVAMHQTRQAIVKGILSVCEELGITVIVEGIETVQERDYLQGLGVRYMQGYLFARPALNGLQAVHWKQAA